MDREKYINSQDYRDGYDKGVEDGREQIKTQINYVSYEIMKILNTLQDVKEEAKGENNES